VRANVQQANLTGSGRCGGRCEMDQLTYLQWIKNQQNAQTRDVLVRSYAGVYRNRNPALDELIRRREAREDYKRRFGNLPG